MPNIVIINKKTSNVIELLRGFLVNEGPKANKNNPATISKVETMMEGVIFSLIHKPEPITTINKWASSTVRTYDKSTRLTAMVRNNQAKTRRTPPISQNLFLNKKTMECMAASFARVGSFGKRSMPFFKNNAPTPFNIMALNANINPFINLLP